jgi:hypothetical protein
MCFLPSKDRKGPHKFVKVTFSHSVPVSADNADAIATALGIKGKDKAKLKAGTLHVIHEPPTKRKKR